MRVTLYVPDASAPDLQKFRQVLKILNVSLSSWFSDEVVKRVGKMERQAHHIAQLNDMINQCALEYQKEAEAALNEAMAAIEKVIEEGAVTAE